MRRFERRRIERLRRMASAIGLSFAIGALVDTALTWRLHEFEGDVFRLKPEATSVAEATARLDGSTRSVATSGIVSGAAAVQELQRRDLTLPVDGVDRDDLRDTFSDARTLGLRKHEALDIMAPRYTPVRAVEDGTITKLFNSRGGGGLTVYQFDPSNRFAYYYAHLDGYARGLAEGQSIGRGQIIGYVGSTGNASSNSPHLHFGIFRLTPERQWWKGDPINPYPVFHP